MAKSKWKNSFLSLFSLKILYKIFFLKLKKKKKKLFFSRDSIVFNKLLFNTIIIHKGSWSRKIFLKKYHLGKKLGEFAYTRKPFFFPEKKKKKR